MFTCEKCEKIISRYILGALPPWSRIAVTRHLDKCQPCQKVVEGHYRVAMMLDRLPSNDPPVGLWNRISNELEHEAPGHQKVPSASYNWRPSVAVAAAGLTAGVFLGQFLGAQDQAKPDVAALESSPNMAIFVRQHSRMAAEDPLADPVSLAAYQTVAFRDNERIEGEIGSSE